MSLTTFRKIQECWDITLIVYCIQIYQVKIFNTCNSHLSCLNVIYLVCLFLCQKGLLCVKFGRELSSLFINYPLKYLLSIKSITIACYWYVSIVVSYLQNFKWGVTWPMPTPVKVEKRFKYGFLFFSTFFNSISECPDKKLFFPSTSEQYHVSLVIFTSFTSAHVKTNLMNI